MALSRNRTERGFSLVESVVGLFILLTAFTFVATIYNHSLSHLKGIERREGATQFLSNTLEELRSWARDPANYSQPTWAPFTNVVDPNFPGLEVRITTEPANLAASCDTLEQAKLPADRVSLSNSAKLVTARVFYQGNETNKVSTLISEPERTVHPTDPVEVTEISAVTTPLAREAEIRFEAKLLAADGTVIPDVNFNWAVVPSTGNASISQVSSSGEQGTLRNSNTYYAGPVYYTGGRCKAEASTVYRGVQYIGFSNDVELAP